MWKSRLLTEGQSAGVLALFEQGYRDKDVTSQLRKNADAGQPMSLTEPNSLTAREFMHLGERVAVQLANQALAKPRKPTIMLKSV